MKYNQIVSDNHIVLKEFYIDESLVVNLSNCEGVIYINGTKISISDEMSFIIPIYSYVSCDIKPKLESINFQMVTVDDDIVSQLFDNITHIAKEGELLAGGDRIYSLATPESVARNFRLINKSLPLIIDPDLEQTLLKQSLFFILKAIVECGIDVYNTLRYNYDESKERAIARLIIKAPQNKWTVGEVAKQLFTTSSTLRRHLAKEGVSFSQLLVDVRMGVALNYLTFTNYSVLQISHRSGFGSSAYFCDVFKRKYGVTPLQFRTQSREGNDILSLVNMHAKHTDT